MKTRIRTLLVFVFLAGTFATAHAGGKDGNPAALRICKAECEERNPDKNGKDKETYATCVSSCNSLYGPEKRSSIGEEFAPMSFVAEIGDEAAQPMGDDVHPCDLAFEQEMNACKNLTGDALKECKRKVKDAKAICEDEVRRSKNKK